MYKALKKKKEKKNRHLKAVANRWCCLLLSVDAWMGEPRGEERPLTITNNNLLECFLLPISHDLESGDEKVLVHTEECSHQNAWSWLL